MRWFERYFAETTYQLPMLPVVKVGDEVRRELSPCISGKVRPEIFSQVMDGAIEEITDAAVWSRRMKNK